MKKYLTMAILKQFDPLIIEEVEESCFSCSHHSHSYYEMVYIDSGKGKHLFNDDVVPYEMGNLFLIAPGDYHSFQIDEPTHFIYIKFTESYFESKQHLAPDEFRVGSPEILMEMKWLKEVKICIKPPCDSILRSTVHNLMGYASSLDVSNSPIVYYQLLSIFGMIREILRERNLNPSINGVNFEKLLSYLHENIYDRNKLGVSTVANKFNISTTYFSNYFKRHFNVSYQSYLDQYRVSLIKKRLAVGGVKLKEIALEFGFTDTSHLTKTFKKVTGLTPKQYNGH
ncbi:helix-turn-helix domain-containing protein [Echinicola shivajiensis]|uniref:helix-turn-helix domain-containing protein n=1 Tax=Echinicola shivajiensis TaxID=1035916 RepID=UPI001BFC51E6|nr:AraC family transcriptional regulator [Echinicola shivajiensis]